MAITDPGIRVILATEDRPTELDQTWVLANADGIMFTRSWTNANRALFDTGNTIIGQYVNFTTMRIQEYDDWEDRGISTATLDSYLLTDNLGDRYLVNGASEYLCDFSNTAWLDFRLSEIPDWEGVGMLGTSNIDYLSMDLCPLYPVPNLIGTQNNPFGTPTAWKAAMLACVGYVRTKIDAGIQLACNGLREFVGVPGFTADPAAFDAYDGTALISPGVYADAATAEADFDLPGQSQRWLYTLRALYRASLVGITGAAWKVDTTADTNSPAEIQKRINHFVSHALVYLPNYTVATMRSGNEFSPYPLQTFPEEAINLGTPDQAVDSRFTSYSTPALGLITRTFTGGDADYVMLFNYNITSVAIPTAYRTGYEQVRPNGFFQIVDGVTQAALTTAAVGTTLGAGHGMILQPQLNTLTVTADALEHLTGECTLYFGVSEEGQLIDSGWFPNPTGEEMKTLKMNLGVIAGTGFEFALEGAPSPGSRTAASGIAYTGVGASADEEILGGSRGRWNRVRVRNRTAELGKLDQVEITQEVEQQ